MRVVADLHLHSKYSRAVSAQMVLPVMAKTAVEKGINLLTASDWTHPVWLKEISALLEEAGEGVYRLQAGSDDLRQIRFVLSTEISSIYKQGDKLRRIHNLIFISSLTKAEEFSKALVSKGCNIGSDGRPIVGLTARQVLELLLQIDDQGFLIPCHVWTPHFGLYGSASGFDSIEEAFGDLSDHIFGIETGLSSDPEMNWQIPELATRSILSFSDAHSPAKIGREVTVFDLEAIDFKHLKQAIMQPSQKSIRGTKGIKGNPITLDTSGTFDTSDTSHIIYTVEFYPEEGKYHYSGHRNCKVRYTPQELKEKGNICPVCKHSFTEGVFVRLTDLAQKESLETALVKPDKAGLNWVNDPHKIHPPFVKLVPLLEVIAESMGSTVTSQKVKDKYVSVLKILGSELDILLQVPLETIALKVGERIAEGISKVRRADLIIEPGYDGEYGVVKLWGNGSKSSSLDAPQMRLDL